MARTTAVNPVFLKTKDIPDADVDRPIVLEMCLAAEKVAGRGSMIGAQEIRGLWRLYPANREARNELLIKGMRLRNAMIQVSNTNPFMLKDETGEEKPITKVWVDNLPISVADSEMEHSLTRIGCELRSDVKAERARDADHKLTRFLTGRRFVFITTPTTPLERSLKISLFTAKIFHREQKLVSRTVICSKCLEQGHHSSGCDKDIVCRSCKLSGHKRGDPVCKFSTSVGGGQVERSSSDKSDQQSETGARAEGTTDKTDDDDGRKEERDERRKRGRVNSRQTTLRPTLELDHPRRHRSETPKRRRSREATSPGRDSGARKQSRREDGLLDSQAPAEPTADAGVWG